ncbi:MAG: hypothetical protein IJZ85_00415 [Lachnospiraceae bacterium]|nr:hypothetical protein [Lachnospiraceae bacterium]
MSNIAERGAHRCEHIIANHVKTTLERPQSGPADTVTVELSGEPRLWSM